ncbi:MAG: hypothetical protein Q8Q08_05115 [Candidatus Omnitrophota bacterium]|nr:hypothetical protein [Candidatus Omnitrophota bacterium]
MKIFNPDAIFFSIILITGCLTVITDLRLRKIYNTHLAVGTVLGFAAIIYAAAWAKESVVVHFINGLLAFTIGFCLHRFGLWRGGDAKLFALYAFLMPPLQGGNTLFTNAVDLFACSFIAGTIILMPFLIKNTVSHFNTLIKTPLPLGKLKSRSRAVGVTALLSWAFFPVFHFAGALHTAIAPFLITFFIFYLYHFIKKTIPVNYFTVGGVIAFGAIMRLWLSPSSLSWPVLPYSILKITLFTLLSANLYIAIENLKEKQDRVPFAPLLFMGCMLSYSSFLINIVHSMERWNGLLFR